MTSGNRCPFTHLSSETILQVRSERARACVCLLASSATIITWYMFVHESNLYERKQRPSAASVCVWIDRSVCAFFFSRFESSRATLKCFAKTCVVKSAVLRRRIASSVEPQSAWFVSTICGIVGFPQASRAMSRAGLQRAYQDTLAWVIVVILLGPMVELLNG